MIVVKGKKSKPKLLAGGCLYLEAMQGAAQ